MTTAKSSPNQIVVETLRSVRTLLGMEVAFVAEIRDGRRIFRYIDSDWEGIPITVGGSDPVEDSYCQRVLDGRLPELIRDATKIPEALKLPATLAVPVGAHLSVPITLSDGHVYGTYCCFSRQADETLNERDIRAMRLFADITGKLLEKLLEEERARDEAAARIRATLDNDLFAMVYQSIFNVVEQRIVGHEALARFSAEPIRTPDVWFNEAAIVGLQEALELAAIRKALPALEHFPSDTYLSLNVSPETILSGTLTSVLDGYPKERLVLEVTEHVSVKDYSLIAVALQSMRQEGLRLAVDDAGAGFASFRHILKLKPDMIKLDSSLIRQIDSNSGCRALAAAIVRFAEETGSKVVAEGVETAEELDALRELKVNNVQGFLLGRPAPLSAGRLGR